LEISHIELERARQASQRLLFRPVPAAFYLFDRARRQSGRIRQILLRKLEHLPQELNLLRDIGWLPFHRLHDRCP
jgi:hypothetical protein